MVHHQTPYDHRHSSYYPPTTFDSQDTVNNKNYHQHSQQKLRNGSIKNKNNNNHSQAPSSSSSSTNGLNDNDTFVRFWSQSANNGSGSTSSTGALLPCHPCGPITATGITNGNNAVENDVRWSKLLRHDGTPSKVLLYPEEGWARTATNAYWLLSIPWWNRNRCKVVEVTGTRRSTTQAKLIDAGRGTVYVVGSFKNSSATSSSTCSDLEPEFKLALTSRISPADVNLGYAMTGTLERGRHGDCLQPTHFAVLRKFDWND